MPPPESSRRDLQAGKGPGAPGAQKMMKKKEILLERVFGGFFFFWVIVLSPF